MTNDGTIFSIQLARGCCQEYREEQQTNQQELLMSFARLALQRHFIPSHVTDSPSRNESVSQQRQLNQTISLTTLPQSRQSRYPHSSTTSSIIDIFQFNRSKRSRSDRIPSRTNMVAMAMFYHAGTFSHHFGICSSCFISL